ncbi:DUF7504 family protein [Halovivax limisalsi]|uniref:DUF7504 family protein n=1 Tax=Halovivax limisalsi TaxID=1453760 RepID=UPI001FFD3A02|nr:hypothetical protein [Halovivax limisalsi]
MGSEIGGGASEQISFAQSLDELKRQGSNVLVVGGENRAPQDAVCDRLLGDGGGSTRYRIVVTTDPNRIESHGECGGMETRYLLIRTDDTAGTPADDDQVTEVSLLGTLGTEFVETVDACEADTDLDPSELRVCVDSVADLIDAFDAENVFRLLHAMTTRIRQSRGMGHYHLPIDRTDEAVRLYEPLFDAVITVRSDGDDLTHRWNLRDDDAETDWIPI